MKVIFSALADAATISEGKFNLLGVFHVIQVPALPHILRTMYATATMVVEGSGASAAASGDLTCSLLSPSGTLLVTLPGAPLDRLPPETIRPVVMGLWYFFNVPITETGTHTVTIHHGQDRILTIPFDVQLRGTA